MGSSELLTADELFQYWFEADDTVLCASGENNIISSVGYIEIDNQHCKLFPSRAVGYRYGPAEKEFLMKLADKYL